MATVWAQPLTTKSHLQLHSGLVDDLPCALPGDAGGGADVGEGPGLIPAQPVAEADEIPLGLGELGEARLEPGPGEVKVHELVDLILVVVRVGDVLQQRGVLRDGVEAVEAVGLAAPFGEDFDFAFGDLGRGGDLCARGRPAEALRLFADDAGQAVRQLTDVSRAPDGAVLIVDSAPDALANPPIAVGGELVAPARIE